MTARAGYPPLQYIDGRTGEPFAPTELQSEVEEHKLQDVLIRLLLARVAQYWLMDFYLRVLDQRMSIIGKMRNRIMMGQARQISDDLNEHKEQDREIFHHLRGVISVISMSIKIHPIAKQGGK